MPEELLVEPRQTEMVVLRIESGDLGLIAALHPAIEEWRQEEHPDGKLFVRNSPGVAFEIYLVEKDTP